MMNRPLFYSGLCCIAFGCAVMYHFQHTQGIGFGTFQCLDGRTTGVSTDFFQERWRENFNKLWLLDYRAPLGIFGVIIVCCVRIMRERVALGLTFLSLLAACLVFGIIDECRIYLPFIPLFILAAVESLPAARIRASTHQAPASAGES